MLHLGLVFLVTVTVPRVTGHYVFSRFLFNDTVTEQWEYVRNISIGQTADSGLWDQYMPFYDVYSPDVRCGRGASAPGSEARTATVLAGDEVGFVVGRSADEPLEPYIIYHNGPGQAYLSRSENTDLSSYEGDGEWFKIASLGAKNDTWWSTRGQTGMNFTVPRTTPPGKYLLRVEHLYVRPAFNTTQFYIACAQIDVLGQEGVEKRLPGPGYMVKFPGAYDLFDDGESDIQSHTDVINKDETRVRCVDTNIGLQSVGIWVADHIYEWPASGLLKYKAPGPPVWTG